MKEQEDNSWIVVVKSSAMCNIHRCWLFFFFFSELQQNSALTARSSTNKLFSIKNNLCPLWKLVYIVSPLHFFFFRLWFIKKNVNTTRLLTTSCFSPPGKSCRISQTAATGSRPATMWPSATWSRWTETFTSRTSGCRWKPSCGERSTTGTGLPNR